MSVTNVTEKKSVSSGPKRNTNIVRLILEGRAFFALIVIIAVFSFLSPYYFTLNNFLIMKTIRASPTSARAMATIWR